MLNLTLQYTAARLIALAKATAVCTPLCLSDYGVAADNWGVLVLSAECSRSTTHLALIAKWQAERSLTSAEVARLRSVLTEYPADQVRAELAEELRWIMGERKLATVAPLTVEDVRQASRAVEAGLTPFVVPDVS